MGLSSDLRRGWRKLPCGTLSLSLSGSAVPLGWGELPDAPGLLPRWSPSAETA